jgi:hypothetical protein
MNYNTRVPKPKVHIVIGNKANQQRVVPSNTANIAAKSKATPFAIRKKLRNEALAQTRNIWTDELYLGEDLKPFEGRPGSMDAYSLPSLGVRT